MEYIDSGHTPIQFKKACIHAKLANIQGAQSNLDMKFSFIHLQ